MLDTLRANGYFDREIIISKCGYVHNWLVNFLKVVKVLFITLSQNNKLLTNTQVPLCGVEELNNEINELLGRG